MLVTCFLLHCNPPQLVPGVQVKWFNQTPHFLLTCLEVVHLLKIKDRIYKTHLQRIKEVNKYHHSS